MKFYFISFVGRPIVEWSIFIMDNCMLFFLSVIVWCGCAMRASILVLLIASNI